MGTNRDPHLDKVQREDLGTLSEIGLFFINPLTLGLKETEKEAKEDFKRQGMDTKETVSSRNNRTPKGCDSQHTTCTGPSQMGSKC